MAIGILGQGSSALIGNSYEALTVTGLSKIALPGLSDLPVVGGLFIQDPRCLADPRSRHWLSGACSASLVLHW